LVLRRQELWPAEGQTLASLNQLSQPGYIFSRVKRKNAAKQSMENHELRRSWYVKYKAIDIRIIWIIRSKPRLLTVCICNEDEEQTRQG
jgi:hypothetical protein